jgi:hypothetical protein
MIIHQAVNADSFVDTIGVNIHLHYTNTVYNQFEGIIKPSLLDLGVRHVRDGAKTHSEVHENHFYYQRVRALANEGIRFNFITQSLDPPWGDPTNYDLLDEVYTWSNGAISAFEAVNEPDLQGVDSWLSDTLSGQEQLYSTVKNTPLLQHLPVVGPSVVHPWNTDSVGDLSDLLDFGNIHNYFGSRHPETPGWGDGGYGSIAWNLAQAAKVSGTDPVKATETGWHNTVDADGNFVGIPQDVEAKYVPRLFLTHFNEGVSRTFLYELIDIRDNPTDRESNFGLLNNDGTPQPAYHALKNIIELLEDPGAAFTPTPLGFSLEGQTSDVDHTLMQKQDGTYFLAIWLGKASWNPDAKSRIAVPPQTVTLNLPVDFTSATLHQFGPDGLVQPLPSTLVNGQLTFSVKDTVTLIELPSPPAYHPRLERLPVLRDTSLGDEGAPLLADAPTRVGETPAQTVDPLLVASTGENFTGSKQPGLSASPTPLALPEADLTSLGSASSADAAISSAGGGLSPFIAPLAPSDLLSATGQGLTTEGAPFS